MKRLQLRTQEIAWREVDGEILVLGLKASSYFSTNAAGTLLWKRLAAGATRVDLVEQLAAEYGISHDQASADVELFLAALRECGLLET